jgi:hypothetical protein
VEPPDESPAPAVLPAGSPFNGVVPPVSKRFTKGNRAGPGALPNSRKFTAWVRAFLEKPETAKLIEEKINRDLTGDGPATFALRMFAYGYGEPKQTLELVARDQARRLAEEAGVSPEALIATAERLVGIEAN